MKNKKLKRFMQGAALSMAVIMAASTAVPAAEAASGNITAEESQEGEDGVTDLAADQEEDGQQTAETQGTVERMEVEPENLTDDNDGQEVSGETENSVPVTGDQEEGTEPSGDGQTGTDEPSVFPGDENPGDEPEDEPEANYYLQGNRLVNEETGEVFTGTGFVRVDEEFYYVVNGVWDSTRKDIIRVTNVEGSEGEWWYVRDGKTDFQASTVASNANGWWKITDGRVDFSYDGVARNGNGWWRIESGKVNFNFTGFAENQNGWWYCEKGQVRFDQNTVLKGTVKGISGWWYVRGSQVIFTDTVAQNSNGWWCIRDGRVDFGYNGFARNGNGWWYCRNGKVDFNVNSVVKGTVNGEDGWWYVVGGKVTFADTVARNSNGWWRIENGKVNFSCNSVKQNENGWWYIRDGKVDFTYNGLAENNNGCWLIRNGKADFSARDVVKGTVNGVSGWWYVEGGKVTYKDTVAPNSNGWWCIENGKVNFSCNSVEQNGNGWWKIRNGKVDFSFTGLAQNNNGWWYCQDGKVQFGVTSVIKGTVDGETAWWYVSGGKVEKGYTGLGTNSNGTWLIENGRVNFSFTGKKTINGIEYTFEGGRCTSLYRGWQRLGGKYYYFDRNTGAMMKNCTVDGIRLNSDGSAVSSTYNNEKIRTMMTARSIMESITNKSDSREVKLQKCFNWVMNHPYKRYRTLKVARQTAGWEMLFANDHFERGNGCCVSDACAFAFLAHECGYATVYVCDDTGHAWTEIDGYAYDPLFAQSKNYNDNYKAPYGVYKLHPVNKTKI